MQAFLLLAEGPHLIINCSALPCKCVAVALPPLHHGMAPSWPPAASQVAAVRVTGPRYWHQLLAAQQGAEGSGCGPSLAALYATRTLFVQRKAGALPYADDPSGAACLGAWES
jgi:hypothetical protein